MKGKLNEIKVLCDLELSIINDGKIEHDETGYFAHDKEIARLREFSKLQDKYHYGWYIAKDKTVEEQLKAVGKFKMFILENYMCD